MSIALLIIDVQKLFVEMPGFKESFINAKAYINEVSRYFRIADLPVIHIQHIESKKDYEKIEYQVSDEIIQDEKDLYVIKAYPNAFWKTDLEQILKDKNVEFVICCGLAASECVYFTYNGAKERDFNVAMLQNGLVDRESKLVDMIHKNCNVTSYNTIKYLLDNMS
jgi:nicotinamidase-related amidase